MKLYVLVCAAFLLSAPVLVRSVDEDEGNSDFAEFEDFDAEDGFEAVPTLASKTGASVGSQEDHFQSIDDDADDEDDGLVEVESEFEHFHDEEEFEGFTKSETVHTPVADAGEPKLTMAKVPLHFRTHWDSYWMEMLALAGLMAYFANYFLGRNKNTKLANLWLSTHKSLLEDNFVLIGDDGKIENEDPGFVKESESLYTLWCSGRSCCEGMLVELKMIKRQDLVAILADIMRPVQDQIHFKVEISKEAMDTFVFCVASRRTATRLFKETADLVSESFFFLKSVLMVFLFHRVNTVF